MIDIWTSAVTLSVNGKISMRRLSQNSWLLLLLPLLLSLLFIRDRMTVFSEDGAAYVLLAKSLWSGTGYSVIWAEGAPLCVHFPPLVPVMLAPFRGLFGSHLWPVHFFMALWFFAGGWMGYLLLRRHISPPLAALWTTFIMTTPLMPEDVASANSEFPYIVFSLGGLLLLDDREKISLARWAAALLCFALAFYLRTIGFVLFFSAALWVLVRPGERAKWKKAVGILAVSAFVMLPWSLWTRIGSGGRTYTQELLLKDPYAAEPIRASMMDFASRLGGNILYYAGELAVFLTYEMGQVRRISPVMFVPGTAILLGLILVGWWRWTATRKSPAPVYLLLYFGPLLLWFWQYMRFLGPVLILCGICLAFGLIALGEKIWGEDGRKRTEKVMAWMAAILILGNLAGIAHHLRQPMPPAIANFYKIHEPLKAVATPQHVVVTPNPAITGLLGEVKTRGIAGPQSEQTVLKIITGANWMIVGDLDKEARESMMKVVNAHPGLFKLEAREGDILLYRIVKPDI